MASSKHASMFCPFCQKHTSLEPALGEGEIGGRSFHGLAVVTTPKGRAWIATCNACEEFVLVVEKRWGSTIYPYPLPSPTDPRIHNVPRLDLEEAKRCFSVAAYNAAATMARRSVQATVTEKGAKGGSLITQIDSLAEKGVITKDLAAWAHEVRFVGNDGAHPPDAATADDAKDALALAEQFLTVVYVAPAIAEERRQARESAKKAK